MKRRETARSAELQSVAKELLEKLRELPSGAAAYDGTEPERIRALEGGVEGLDGRRGVLLRRNGSRARALSGTDGGRERALPDGDGGALEEPFFMAGEDSLSAAGYAEAAEGGADGGLLRRGAEPSAAELFYGRSESARRSGEPLRARRFFDSRAQAVREENAFSSAATWRSSGFATAESLSEAFCRDARRYDGGFIKY